jgi:hypothetical protein
VLVGIVLAQPQADLAAETGEPEVAVVGLDLEKGGAETDGEGDQAVISIKFEGSVFVNFADTGVDFSGNNFGYYLATPETGGPYTYYSDTSLNADGQDHLAVYQGTNTDTVQIADLAAGLWTDNEFILAWEDLYDLGDKDYEDFVVMVESVLPVPEPGTMIISGLFLLGAGFYVRKKLHKGA